MRLFRLLCVLSLSAVVYGCSSFREDLLEKAAGGEPGSQGILSGCYLNGYLFKVNYELAAKWSADAAAKGDPFGLYVAGVVSYYGLGSATVDTARAASLFARAVPALENLARQGVVQAQYDLGTAYLYGRGVDKDYAKAAIWIGAAARKSFPPAQAELGMMYLQGMGVEADISKAQAVLSRAAALDIPEAQTALGDIYYSRGNFISAARWYQQAAERLSPRGITALAGMNRDGKGMERDGRLAIGLLTQAAEMSYPPAMTDLADMLLEERGADRDVRRAVTLYRRAIAKDYGRACKALADYYYPAAEKSGERLAGTMVLYQLAANNGFDGVKSRIERLDALSGIYVFIKYGWGGTRPPSDYIKFEPGMDRIISGYKSGMVKGSHEVLEKGLETSPLSYYYGMGWYKLYKNSMPMAWAGEILRAVAKTHGNEPFFWLTYGTCANLAGRPELAMSAVGELRRIAADTRDAVSSTELRNLAALINCCSLVQRGLEARGYDSLFAYGRFPGQQAQLVNYINNFATPVLKDKNKFTVASGLNPAALGEAGAFPVPTDFYDYESGGITPPGQLLPEPSLSSADGEKKH